MEHPMKYSAFSFARRVSELPARLRRQFVSETPQLKFAAIEAGAILGLIAALVHAVNSAFDSNAKGLFLALAAAALPVALLSQPIAVAKVILQGQPPQDDHDDDMNDPEERGEPRPPARYGRDDEE